MAAPLSVYGFSAILGTIPIASSEGIAGAPHGRRRGDHREPHMAETRRDHGSPTREATLERKRICHILIKDTVVTFWLLTCVAM